jgi:hypothetical protein
MGGASSAGASSTSVGDTPDSSTDSTRDQGADGDVSGSSSGGAATPSATGGSSAVPTSPGMSSGSGAGASTGGMGATSAAGQVAAGQSLKDNTGAVVGQISEVKTDAKGDRIAVIKMGEESFSVAASSLAVQNGAAVINLTQAQLQAMVKQAGAGSAAPAS